MVEEKSAIADKEFLDKRMLFMEGDFTEAACSKLMKELLYLSAHNEKEPVALYIDSYGGSVYELMRIYSILKVRLFKLTTVVIGKAMSAGAYLLLVGDDRIAYPFSTIMLHEIASQNDYKKLHDLEDDYKEATRLQRIIIDLVKEHTKIKDVKDYLKRDQFLSPKAALKLGVVDRIRGEK